MFVMTVKISLLSIMQWRNFVITTFCDYEITSG
jgi:hypothetical protein